MAFIYNILPRGGDVHHTAPYWFAAFVRFETRDTFTRDKLSSSPDNVSSIAASDAVKEIGSPLIATDDIVSWNISTSKASHVASCTLQLTNNDVDYSAELAPGDWMGFWCFDNKADYSRVLSIVVGSAPGNDRSCNGFRDGLKMIGRVEGVRRNRTRDPMGGLRTNYTVNCQAFSEFDSFIYYNQFYLAKYRDNALLWMADFGGEINNLFLGYDQGSGVIQSQAVIPKLLRICLGVTQSENDVTTGGGDQSTTDSADSGEAASVSPDNAALNGTINKSYLVPATIGAWLGAESEIKDALSYVDILRLYIGIQQYKSGTANRSSTDVSGFAPTYRSFSQNTYIGATSLTGEYRVQPFNLDNKSVWSILGTFINKPIDEMYTCMRVDPNGKIMPSLVVRQNTFSTYWYSVYGDYTVTAFTDIPRWHLSSDLVEQESVGRDNAVRFNMVLLPGQDLPGTNQQAEAVNFVLAPPVVDPADINRSGLRMASQQLSTNVNGGSDVSDAPGKLYHAVMADILFGSHLKFGGQVVSKGIQEPVAEGDNLEYDGIIYHIEALSHTGSIAMNGTRDFRTTFSLSNGIPVENENLDSLESNKAVPSGEIVYPDANPTAPAGTTENE